MPISFFYCPDGETIDVDDCLRSRGCRLVNSGALEARCAPREILQEHIKERDYTGALSVTQLENDSLYHWLKWRTHYGVNPRHGAARIIGSAGHYLLQNNPVPGAMVEQVQSHPLFFGTADSLSEDEYNPGKFVLRDWKIYSIWSIQKLLGMTIVDWGESDTEVYKRAGKHQASGRTYSRGDPRIFPIYGQDPELRDIGKESRQLNLYRIAAEREGTIISRMEVVAILRDYGKRAKDMGLDHEFYTVPIPRIDDEELLGWVAERQETTRESLYSDTMPPMCDDETRWYGRRCAQFCDVRFVCPYGGDNAIFVPEPIKGMEQLPEV